MARRNRCRCNHSPRGGGQNRKKMKILNRYSKPNSRRHEPGCGRIRGVPPGYIFLFAASCLAMSSCTWEEFPDEPAVLQKPVALSFATAVETAPEADTRVIRPGTDFGGNAYFPVGKYAIGIHLYNLNGSEVFEGSDNMKGLMTIDATGTGTGTDNDEWDYWNSQGKPVTPQGFPGTRIRRMAYTPYDPKATIDSIPFDFTNKVNVEPQYGQANLLLCSTGETDIPADPLANPIQLRFKNAYTKVVLRITKKENKNDNQNIGKVTETAIDNLTAEWIKNRGGIDPSTGYVKPTSEPGKIWNDSTATLTTTEPVEFTFLVPAFMDKDVKDDNFGFVLQIDGQQRLFPLKKSQLNTGADAGNNKTYGFESNRINTYNLVYNNSLLFLSLQSWSSVDASAGFGQTAEKNPTFTLDLSLGIWNQKNGYYVRQKAQKPDSSTVPELNYPKDTSEDPYVEYPEVRPPHKQNSFIYTTSHVNNTYLSSVLLGGNGPAVPENKSGRLYTDYEQPYVKLQVTALDVGGKAVIWQDGRGGLIAKDVCRNYRGNGFTDWRLPRVTEMKIIMMWAVYNRSQMGNFLGKTNATLEKEDAKLYWTATEADMGTPDEVDAQETAWYVQGYINSLSEWNYKVATRNKQEAAFIRCVREM